MTFDEEYVDPHGECAHRIHQLEEQLQNLITATIDLVCCPAFTGALFERDKESHRAWTLAREATTTAAKVLSNG